MSVDIPTDKILGALLLLGSAAYFTVTQGRAAFRWLQSRKATPLPIATEADYRALADSIPQAFSDLQAERDRLNEELVRVYAELDALVAKRGPVEVGE